MSFFRHRKSSQEHSLSPTSLGGRRRSSAVSTSSAPSAAESEEEKPWGLEEWVNGENSNVDIVFIHGLGGHREGTWRAENGVLWPTQLLHKELPQTRILGFGYDSRTHALKDLSHQTFHGHATTLLQNLSLYRRTTKTVRRPIIFVAHSLGGLVVKSALICSNLAGKDHIEYYKAISTSTYGILFFGTPHQGGNGVSLGKLVASIASIVLQTNKGLLDHLEKNSQFLEQQLHQYTFIANQFDTKFCYETVKTTKYGVSMMIVDKSSAVIPGQGNAELIEMHKSHTEMVRMKSAKDNDYKIVAMHMRLMCEEAPRKIEDRWSEYDRLNDCESARTLAHSSIEDDYRLALQLGYKPNSHFTGRGEMLESLHLLLTISSMETNGLEATTVVLLGIGGVGKTQLARQYAYTYCAHHTSISWINGTSLETTYTSFHELARRLVRHYAARNKALIPPYTNLAQHLGMPGLIDGDGQIIVNYKTRGLVVEAVKGWFSSPNNTGWLVIFDNVDDLDSFNIGEFFPTAAANGKILITTRRRECTRFGEELELDVMQKLESIELLQRSCKRKQAFTGQEHDEASRIVERLGYLPLAIDQAGAYLHTMRKQLASYLPLLHHTHIKETLSRKPPSSVWHYEESVFSTWELSFQAIQGRHPKAAELLTLCSFLSNGEIQPDMLERGLSIMDPQALPIDEMISPLLSFSLITRNITSENFSIHPLVHDWARERLPLDQKIDMARKAFKTVFASLRTWEIWTTGVRKPEDWQYERRITLHIEAVISWVEDILPKDEISFEHAPQLMTLANVYFYEGRYPGAEKWYLRALASREKNLGQDHPDTLAVAQGLATVNRFQGRWTESQRLYERVLEGRKKIDPNHLDTLATVQSLAVLYRHRGRLDDSIQLYQWALYGEDNCGKGIEGQQGPTHPNTIHTVFGYAIVLQHQGKYEDALVLYEQVLAQRKAELGANHPDTLTVMQNVADASRRIGQLNRAEVMFGEVLDAREKYLGPLHPDTLRTAEGLANVYRDQHRFEKSEKLYSQALNGREEKLGFDHADTLATVHNVAVSYRMQGKLDEANTLYLRALEGRQREGSLGRGHLDTLRTVEGLGRIAEDQQRYSEAEKRYRRVLAGFQKQMPEGCPDVVRAVENMARILEKLGRHEDAIPYCRRLSTTSKSESNEGEAEMERRSSAFSGLSVSSGGGSTKGSLLERWQSSSSRRLSALTKSESVREEPEIECWSEDLRNLSMCSNSENPEPLASFSSTQGQ